MKESQPNANTISTQISIIEQRLNLDSPQWLVENTHLWPLYRLELRRLMFVDQTKQTNRKNTRPKVNAAFRRCRDSSSEAQSHCDIWLVSDGISFSTLGGVEFERFCNPIFNVLSALGRPSVLIDRASPQPRQTTIPTRWWTPITQRAKLFGVFRAAITPDARHRQLVDQIKFVATQAGIELPLLSAKRFNAIANAVLSLATRIEKKMRNERVKAVFVVGYYDVGGYAHILAANRANITAVDVQHGVAGELHLAYSNWNREPAVELALLPRYFLCWTQKDADVVQHWIEKHHRTKRQTYVSGHPFLDAWKRGEVFLTSGVRLELLKLIKSSLGRPTVLVTLQPGLSTEKALEPLLKTWDHKPDVYWWIRMHPLALHDRAYIESILRNHQINHWDIEAATSLPLPALLEHTSLHATHSSSTVIEAEFLGVSSIIWSEYGEQLFDPQIQRGTAVRVVDSEDFLRKLNLDGNQQERPSNNDVSNQLLIAVKKILETTK